jgi:sec-independent protein translocase protein TatC
MSSQENANFLEHLEALRNVLLKSAGCFLLFCIPAWYFSKEILQILLKYAAPEGFKLHYFTVMEPFLTLLKIALILALTASIPFTLHWVWGFVAPALTKEERRKLAFPVFLMFFLALGGAAVAIFFILPAMINFSMSFTTSDLEPVIGIGDFVSLILVIVLAAMAMFQFPVILLGLLTTGVLQLETVRSKRPHIIVVIFILAAVFSPPDVFSQLLLAIPTYILFEATLLFYAIRQKKDDSYDTIYQNENMR